MARSRPINPDYHRSGSVDGPWIRLIVGATVAWVALMALDRRLLVEGTFLWATVRSVTTLLLAPVVAAAVPLDARNREAHRDAAAADAERGSVGLLRWLYAGLALPFPPVALLYLAHQTAGRRLAVTE